MAPSRRKGAAKAAAAAAARRQWKVGDLVLAKVKGFPAWPATVSEPEKWGYSADWKKVLVYFFGTQQIAFCNPADVEAFTEEKKQTLLIKRQGKGADFVRAVQEIIESYEKSKLQEQIDISKSTDGVTIANGENSMDPLQDLGEASGATLDSQSKASDSCKAKNDQSLPTEDASAAEQIVALHDNATCETHNKCAVVKETPILTTYSSRKRSGGLRAQKSVTQRKAPSTRRSRSSSRVESHRCQSFTTQCNDGDQSAGDMSANVIQDGGLRRNKRIRKLPGGSEWEYMGSAALMSNGSIEDNGSEIATVDSDNVSLNEGSAIESDCKLGHSDNVVECLEGDVELSKGLDFQIKAVVIKKKRKPNRKRGANDAAEPPVKMDVEADLQTGVKNTCQNSQNSCENSNERFSKENGDEHLPLVKRARVRMSKSLSTEEDVKTSSQVEGEAAKEVTVNMSGEVSLSAIGDNDNCVVEEAKSLSQSEEKALRVAVNMPSAINGSHNRTDGDSFVAAEVLDNISSPKVSTQSSGDTPTDIDSSIEKRAVYIVSPSKACTRPQLWKVAKTQFGCSADGEAALPPSKRLHRAMEAMSANAVEEGQTFAEASSTMKTIINESCGPSLRYSQKINESRQGSNQELDTVTSFTNSTSGFCCSSNPILSEESSKSSAEEEILKQPIECSAIQKHESCEDVSVEPMDPACSKDHGGSAFDACSVQTVVQSQLPQSLLPQSPSLPSKDKMSVENANFSMFRAEKPDKEVHMSRHAEMSQNPVVPSNEIANISVQDGEDLLKWNAERTDSEDEKSSKPQIDGNGQVNSVCEIVEDIKIEQTQKNTRSLPNCNDHSSDKLSPSPTNIVDSPARGSPPVTSICHMSTAESANTIQNNGCSPSVTLRDKKNLSAMVVDEEAKGETLMAQKPKTIGKWSNNAEAHAAISSFEATLAILTRTKESIGRATRMAIDCAKFGDSSKVVEILARNLECESSLHRRVDLFFLVDSITQCSRGLKGDVGGIYPSAIQAALPRLLAAAAPPGAVAQENRRQCLKVLRLWLERRILPETVIRHHMRELDSLSSSSSAGPFSRRSARTERALDDPVRDMEGMLVDEYGSNSTFQLPGFCMPRMLKDEDEGSDSDGGSFEAVTPEHKSELHEEREPMPAIGRHRHILEDVDGELEMEDVAPSCEVEVSSSNNVAGVNTTQTSHGQFSLAFAPPLPQDVPPSSPPLPSSPPPPAPPPPPPPPPLPLSAMTDSNANGVDSEFCQNMHEDSQHSAGLQSVTPIINAAMSTNALHYRGPDYRDLQRPNPISDSTSSFNSFPVHPTNSVQQSDGPSFHHKPYPPRPPQPAPSDQFSYIQAGQHVKSRKDEPPPCYTHRSHFMPNVDSGNFYDNHERMKPNIDSGNFYDNHERMKPNIDSGNFYDNQDRMRPAPYEYRERWRFPEAPFSGPRYFDKARGSFMPGSYAGPPCETTRYSNNRWAYPPRPMNHRNSYPMRPPPEDAVPVGLRAPSIWRPR